VHGVVHGRARAAEARLRIAPIRVRTLQRPRRQFTSKRERLVDELGRLEQPIRDPELRNLASRQHPVLTQRVRHDHLDRGLGADEARQQLRPAPRRKETKEDLREGEVPDGRRDRAGAAVQRQLDAAAETRAVDRRHGWEAQGAQPSEQFVTGAGAFDRALARDLGELRDVGTRSEEERLAGDHGGGEVAALEIAERAVERRECELAEEGRLRPVLSVVDCDESDVAGPRQLELS
jgi:hypothetical protein